MPQKDRVQLQSVRIPGDGRCLFRSVVYGVCSRSGKISPDENNQREMADELRSKVADEFIRRRPHTEWFLEGDFSTYVSQIRRPHVWGGEPELLMCSHVLKTPITVYMHGNDSDGLRVIAEYGQEYGRENPIRVLYHGYGHYDALQTSHGIGGDQFHSDSFWWCSPLPSDGSSMVAIFSKNKRIISIHRFQIGASAAGIESVARDRRDVHGWISSKELYKTLKDRLSI